MTQMPKHVFSIFLLIFLCALGAGSIDDGQTNSKSDKWYSGGTLHRATVAQWKGASYENKLATAADWAASSGEGKELFRKTNDIDSLKPLAIDILFCVEEAVAGDGYENMQIAEIAASCMILMRNQ